MFEIKTRENRGPIQDRENWKKFENLMTPVRSPKVHELFWGYRHILETNLKPKIKKPIVAIKIQIVPFSSRPFIFTFISNKKYCVMCRLTHRSYVVGITQQNVLNLYALKGAIKNLNVSIYLMCINTKFINIFSL